MAVLGKNAVLLVKEFDVTSFFRELEVGATLEELDDTVYGTGTEKSFVPGIEGGESSLGGFWAGGALGADAQFNTIFGSASGPVTIGPNGGAVGDRARLFNAKHTEYTISSPNTDLVGVGVNFSHGSAMGMGSILANLIARIATANGTSQDQAAATTSGYVATLHVPTVTGTTPSMIARVQHSTDNSVWVDLVTFTNATAAASEFKSGTGTVNRYVRATWAILGTTPSFTFAVGFARLYQ